MSKNFSRALTTPMRAPPAMNPEAMRVPLLSLASLRALSFERVLTNHEMAPPTSSGRFRSIGMNIPSANARAGTFNNVSATASTAPMPYSSHGAPPPFIIGWITAAIALACGATSASSPTKP